MTTKRTACLALVLALLASALFSAEPPAAQKKPTAVAFSVGDFYLSPEFLGVTAGVGGKAAVGVNAEYFLTKSIAVGGDVAFFMESPSVLSLLPDIEYHFNSQSPSWDVYAGAGPALFIWLDSPSQTLLGIKAYGAARYFFNPGAGAFLKLGVATDSNSAALFWAAGISIKI